MTGFLTRLAITGESSARHYCRWSVFLTSFTIPDPALNAQIATLCDSVQPDAVYVAGPMRGIPDRNYPAFFAAEARLQDLGYVVVNPARIEDKYSGNDWTGCMRRDLAIISLRCRSVAVLPGWENSPGASLEVHVAKALGMEILDAVTLEPLVLS